MTTPAERGWNPEFIEVIEARRDEALADAATWRQAVANAVTPAGVIRNARQLAEPLAKAEAWGYLLETITARGSAATPQSVRRRYLKRALLGVRIGGEEGELLHRSDLLILAALYGQRLGIPHPDLPPTEAEVDAWALLDDAIVLGVDIIRRGDNGATLGQALDVLERWAGDPRKMLRRAQIIEEEKP